MTTLYDYSETTRWLEPLLPATWQSIFSEILWNFDTHSPANESAASLLQFLEREYADAACGGTAIYPQKEHLFRAFSAVPPQGVRVVLLGQDPYHGEGQAEGLSFSVPDGIKAPPSLRNIFKERESDLGIPAENAATSLLPWAQQGVLLLNTTLSVRAGLAGSHRKHGWETLTDAVIARLDAMPIPMVFLLWGADARKKKRLLGNPLHLILESEHPSPLSAYRGFFGSRPFSAINAYLTAHDLPPINWET